MSQESVIGGRDNGYMRYQYMPPLSEAERAALTDSIATFGVLQAVITDEEGNILDGHHRAEIATGLGLEYPTVTLPGLTDDQKIEQSLLLNLGRRHLDIEQRRELVVKLRADGLSVRWISDKTGIPRSTVQRDAQRVPGGTPEYITGKDGKTYQAKAPVDNGTEHWRQLVSEAVGRATICATADEYYDFLSSSPFRTDLDREEVAEAWERRYLAELGSQWSFKAEGEMPPPPALMYGGSSDEILHRLNALDVWSRLFSGRFLNWADNHGMLDSKTMSLSMPDTEAFTDCDCKDCVSWPEGFTDEDMVIVAVGDVYRQTGVNLWNTVADDELPKAVTT